MKNKGAGGLVGLMSGDALTFFSVFDTTFGFRAWLKIGLVP
jgi:hypothetical protein